MKRARSLLRKLKNYYRKNKKYAKLELSPLKSLIFFLVYVIIFKQKRERAFIIEYNATVAQSVEQLIRNQQVSGSSPLSSSKKTDVL